VRVHPTDKSRFSYSTCSAVAGGPARGARRRLGTTRDDDTPAVIVPLAIKEFGRGGLEPRAGRQEPGQPPLFHSIPLRARSRRSRRAADGARCCNGEALTAPLSTALVQTEINFAGASAACKWL
jgi:hypothetical protein